MVVLEPGIGALVDESTIIIQHQRQDFKKDQKYNFKISKIQPNILKSKDPCIKSNVTAKRPILSSCYYISTCGRVSVDGHCPHFQAIKTHDQDLKVYNTRWYIFIRYSNY